MISALAIYCHRRPSRSSGGEGAGWGGDNVTDGFFRWQWIIIAVASLSPFFSVSLLFFGCHTDEWVGSIISSASITHSSGEGGRSLPASYCCAVYQRWKDVACNGSAFSGTESNAELFSTPPCQRTVRHLVSARVGDADIVATPPVLMSLQEVYALINQSREAMTQT